MFGQLKSVGLTEPGSFCLVRGPSVARQAHIRTPRLGQAPHLTGNTNSALCDRRTKSKLSRCVRSCKEGNPCSGDISLKVWRKSDHHDKLRNDLRTKLTRINIRS